MLGRVVLSGVSYPVRASRGYGFLPAGGGGGYGMAGGGECSMDERKEVLCLELTYSG